MEQPSHPPLAYATPPPARHVRWRFDWGTCLWSAGVIGAWSLLLLLLVPKVEAVFADFTAKLPATTVLLVDCERVIRSGFWFIVIGIPVAIGAATGPLSPGGRRAVRMLLTLAFAGLVVFALLGLLIPMLNLVNSMSGAR